MVLCSFPVKNQHTVREKYTQGLITLHHFKGAILRNSDLWKQYRRGNTGIPDNPGIDILNPETPLSEILVMTETAVSTEFKEKNQSYCR